MPRVFDVPNMNVRSRDGQSNPRVLRSAVAPAAHALSLTLQTQSPLGDFACCHRSCTQYVLKSTEPDRKHHELKSTGKGKVDLGVMNENRLDLPSELFPWLSVS